MRCWWSSSLARSLETPGGTVTSSRVISMCTGWSRFFSKRMSRAVRMPTGISPSTTGTPLMSCSRITPSASRSDWSGRTVMGAPIIPLSARLTRSTSRAWATGLRFLWRMPMPPARAMTMAERPSVTESMAALRRGMLSRIRRVSRVRTSTWPGRISLYAGTRRTSSKVRHSRSLSSSMGTSGGPGVAQARAGGHRAGFTPVAPPPAWTRARPLAPARRAPRRCPPAGAPGGSSRRRAARSPRRSIPRGPRRSSSRC